MLPSRSPRLLASLSPADAHRVVAALALTAQRLAEKPEPWHEIGNVGEPAFENGWLNVGGPYPTAGFYRGGDGFVHLKGLIKSGTVGAAAFTLPLEYRPSGPRDFEPGSGVQFVNELGEVRPDSNHTFDLFGIYFRAQGLSI